MDHAEAMTLLEPYADGELDAIAARRLEKHLEGCAVCSKRLEALHANRAVLGSALDPGPAPDLLRAKIARMTAIETPRRTALPPIWRQAAAVAGVAILASGATFSFLHDRQAASAETLALVDAHVRALEPGRMIEVVSSDKHTVKPWLDARLDFAPPVSDFTAQGYPLLGGRLDYAGGRRSGVLVYGLRKHTIDVFVRPQAGPAPHAHTSINGLTVVGWRSGGFDWRAVSDVGADELERLRSLIGG